MRQIAEALSAAHRAGIVHRDFKSQNVLLVPADEPRDWPERGGAAHHDPGSELRAVVTDFGLARSSGGGGGDLEASASRLAGTPATMAPEQVRGDEATPASDLYAFGVVLYEMMTGKLPFEGEVKAVLYRRLIENPPSPRSVVRDLDARWERTILRCLERDPADRFQSITDAVRAMEGVPVPPGRGARHRAQARRALLGAVGLVLVAASGMYLAHLGRPLRAGSTGAELGRNGTAVPARRSVAILGLKNLSGRAESAWISTALSELLGTEVAAGDRMRLIPGENVARLRLELALPDADSYSRETLESIHRNLGTDLVVLGSDLALGPGAGGRLRLDLRLQDTRAGETLAAVSETGTEQDLLDLVARTGAELRAKLGLPALSADEEQGIAAVRPASTEGARLVRRGAGAAAPVRCAGRPGSAAEGRCRRAQQPVD